MQVIALYFLYSIVQALRREQMDKTTTQDPCRFSHVVTLIEIIVILKSTLRFMIRILENCQ